jgi:SAM-dependent methyltransferase
MAERDPRRRRKSFNTVAEIYMRFRRAYPAEVLAAVQVAAGLGPGMRALEIGCGTGQLSVPLAQVGVEIHAVELGAELAAIARRRLGAYPTASVAVAEFETWPLPPRPFDAVLCANAFHWLDVGVRVRKSAEVLRPGGTLCIVHPHHVRGGSPGFVQGTNPYYVKWGLGYDPDFQPPRPEELRPMYPELEADAAFACVERRRFEDMQRFTAEEYVGMLRTDSLVLGLEPAERAGFLADIEELIHRRYDGAVERPMLYEVIAAKKRSAQE